MIRDFCTDRGDDRGDDRNVEHDAKRGAGRNVARGADRGALPRRLRAGTSMVLLSSLILTACSDSDTVPGDGSSAVTSGDTTTFADTFATPLAAATTGAGTDPGSDGVDGPLVTLADPDADNATDMIAPEPFSQPDPNGSSALARFGYPALLASADALLDARWLDAYLAVADRLPALVGDEAPRAPVAVDCPDGGSATIARGNAGAPGQPAAFDYIFDGCRIDGLELEGALSQRDGLSGSRFNTARSHTSLFEGLVVSEADGSSATLDGRATRTRDERSTPQCGDETTSSTELDVAMDRVLVERRDALAVSLEAVRIDTERNIGYVDRADCTLGRTSRFDNDATARLDDGTARETVLALSRRGSILRPSASSESPESSAPASGQATLVVSADDGTRLTVSATDVANDGAQLDLSDGDVTTALTIDYRFDR